MFTIRKRLSPSEGRPADTRYNESTDTVETTSDAGATWTPNPGADPRINPAYLMPPNTAPDVRCAAAAGMVEDVRNVVNAGIAGVGVSGVGAILLTLAVIPFFWAYLLIVAVASILLLIGSSSLASTFTPEVYEFLLCAFFDNVDEDGRIDASGFAAVKDAMNTEFSNVVINAALDAVWQLHGAVGLSNAGVMLADPAADCSECPGEWCYRWESISDMVADGFNASTMPGLSIYVTTSTGMQLTSIRYSWSSNGLGTGSGSGVAAWANAGATVLIERYLPLAGAPNPFEWDGYYSTSGLALTANATGGSGGTVNFGWVELKGIGVMPPFEHGEVCEV